MGGPVVWMVPSGNRRVSSQWGPNSMIQPSLWILVSCMLHTGRRFLNVVRVSLIVQVKRRPPVAAASHPPLRSGWVPLSPFGLSGSAQALQSPG